MVYISASVFSICCLFDLYSSSSHLRRARSAVQLPIVLLLYIILSMSSFIANFMFQRLGGVEAFLSRTSCPLLPRRLRALSAASCRLFGAPAPRALRGSTPDYFAAVYCFAAEDYIENLKFQRLGGVEPLHQAWEARILPLYYSRVGKAIIAEKRRECKHALPLAVPAVRKLGLSFAALLSYTRAFCYTVFYESNTALYGALCGRGYRRAE